MVPQKFTIGIATPTAMSAAYAYFCPAVALGFDREEGLDFAMFAGGEPGSTARALSAGACDVACLNTIVGFLGRAKEKLPMVAIGSKARRAHRYFAVNPESAVKTLAEFSGKIACDFPHLQPLANAALADEGLSGADYRWVPWRGSGMNFADMIAPMQRGEFDGLFIMDWTVGDARARGVELRLLPSRLLDRVRVSSCYWTTEKRLKGDADSLLRALRAIQKSIVFAFSDPEGTVRLMWDLHPETKPSLEAMTETLHRDVEVLKACLEPMRVDRNDPDPRWCAIPLAEMDAWNDVLVRNGTIDAPVDVRTIFTDALVAGINEFNPQHVQTARRAAVT